MKEQITVAEPVNFCFICGCECQGFECTCYDMFDPYCVYCGCSDEEDEYDEDVIWGYDDCDYIEMERQHNFEMRGARENGG